MTEERDHIFLSYRRDDARGASGRLYDWLRIAFGRDRVFRDVHSIGIGKWRDRIDRALACSKVCVAVIGPRWANAENLARLHQAQDMVRHELASALACDEIVLVPALVEGAELPATEALPHELRALFDVWNVRRVTEDGWEDDTRRLIVEIAQATSLPAGPDLDGLLHDVNTARQRVADLEQARHLQAEQLDAQRRTIDDLTRKLAEASAVDRPGLAAAFAALARGDSQAAEDAFEREYEAQSRVLESTRQTMAQAARHVANLALSRDIAKAVAFYRKALQIEPEHAETLRLLGAALVVIGDLPAATRVFCDSLRAAIAARDDWGEMAALGGLGNVRMLTGDLRGAHVAFTSARTLAQRRLARDPANPEWQRDLSVSHNKIGDVLLAQGGQTEALAAYRKGLEIFEALAALDPANAQWQRDLSVSHERIGDALVAQGYRTEALAAYRKSLAIAEALAARDPANTEWQRDLSVSHDRIGDVLAAQGNGLGALAAYRKGLAIREALAARVPANTQWQRDLAVSHNKIGDVLAAQGDAAGALAAYRKSLEIFEALATRDATNTGWQRDLAVSHNKIGDVLLAQGGQTEALAAYRKGLTIAEALAARDPANTGWQRDLAVSHTKIGDVLLAQGDGPGALVAYRKSLAIREALAARDPANAVWQRDLIVSYVKLSEASGDKSFVQQALKTAELMQQRDILAPRDAWMIDVLKRRAQ